MKNQPAALGFRGVVQIYNNESRHLRNLVQALLFAQTNPDISKYLSFRIN